MHGAPAYGGDSEPEARMLQKASQRRVLMPLVGRLVAQKVSRWACPGIVGLPWRGGCPQVGPRRAQAPEMGPDMGRAKRYAQCGLGDMSALKRNMFRHVC